MMDYLRAHPLARQATESTGRTFEELLEGVRLELGDPLMPESWLITWPGNLVQPQAICDVRALAVLVWFFSEESWEHADHRLAANTYITKEEYALSYSTATKHRKGQSERAQKPRGIVPGIVKRLAREPGTARELWPRLFGMMDDEGLEPQEVRPDILRYPGKDGNKEDGNEKQYTLKTFTNALSEARKRLRS